MNDGLAYLLLFGIFAGCIWGAVSAVRTGMRSRFFFSYRLLEFPILMAGIVLALGPAMDWVQGKETIWAIRIASFAILCGACGILYTFGFLLGLRKRSRSEGIIGLTDY
ncbi:hypothetical protein EH30_15330 [Erythrobacter sp. JL475]|nr:hypothetical protein EH30_15330 [Erythrobacter sp. JL475]